MIFRSNVVAPASFRPDHQIGRVLAHVETELTRRREVAERRGDRLIIEGVSTPGWNARFSGRGVVAFECQPPPGCFTIRVSVLWEALSTSAVFVVAAVLAWIAGGYSSKVLLLAAFGLGACALWIGWGFYKVRLLRRLVKRGITQVAA